MPFYIFLHLAFLLPSGEALAALSRKLGGSANFVDPHKSYNWQSFGMQIYTIDASWDPYYSLSKHLFNTNVKKTDEK